jgi:methionyl-tRNA synthetase
VASYRAAMDRFALQDGMAAAYALIDAANLYITETEPWKLAKDEANAPRVAQILYEVAEALRIAAVLLLPAMPASSAEILRRVGAPKADAGYRLDDAEWNAAGDLVTIKAESMWPRIGGTKSG